MPPALGPIALVVLQRSEGSALHAIDVKGTVQVIDLMLQNARILTRGMNRSLVAVLVETFDGDFASTRDHSHEACKA